MNWGRVRISHDEVRDLIKEAFPDLDLAIREKPSVQVFKKLFVLIVKAPNGRVMIDVSCDRSYDGYKENAEDFGYGATHEFDLIVRPNTPVRDVVAFVVNRSGV